MPGRSRSDSAHQKADGLSELDSSDVRELPWHGDKIITGKLISSTDKLRSSGALERCLCPEETVSLPLLKLVSMCRGAFPDQITPDSWILAPDSSVSISPVRG